MRLNELFVHFISGTPVKRKGWKGYWRYKFGIIEMHNQDGSIESLTDTKDVLFTISGIIQDDWEIATTQNCPILLKEVQHKNLPQHERTSDPVVLIIPK